MLKLAGAASQFEHENRIRHQYQEWTRAWISLAFAQKCRDVDNVSGWGVAVVAGHAERLGVQAAHWALAALLFRRCRALHRLGLWLGHRSEERRVGKECRFRG